MIKVASIQYWLDDNKNKSKRIEEVENLIEQAKGFDLIVLPEVWNIGWRGFDKYSSESENMEGETISRIAEKARKLKTHIMAGTIIEKDGNDLYNTAVLIGPSGNILGKYRKIHLVTRKGSEEVKYLKPGNEVVAVKTELGVIGIGICYDLRFPELYRKMVVEKGVEIILQPAAWPLARVENWMDLNHVRANENLCYLISCNCSGIDRGVQYLGHSTIVDPHGVPIVSSGLFGGIVKGEIDLEDLYKIRKENPHLENRVLSV
jgi:predicted amidohydrolase